MERTTVVTRKPFHEAVVGLIKVASSCELEAIGTLLMTSIIPKGHDELVQAWGQRCRELCWDAENAAYVSEDILNHKHDLEEAKKKKEGESPLDRFQLIDEKHV